MYRYSPHSLLLSYLSASLLYCFTSILLHFAELNPLPQWTLRLTPPPLWPSRTISTSISLWYVITTSLPHHVTASLPHYLTPPYTTLHHTAATALLVHCASLHYSLDPDSIVLICARDSSDLIYMLRCACACDCTWLYLTGLQLNKDEMVAAKVQEKTG
jgi:hypothetical protein